MLIIYLTLLGLVIGSAINAIVWRIYVGKSWTKGRSMCPDCEHELSPKDLIPVLSWLWLRGKCRYCRKGIHWQYPAVEALTAGLFGLSAYILAPITTTAYISLAFWLMILTFLIILAVYDFRWMLLPDKVIYPAIFLSVIYLFFEALSSHSWLVFRGPLGAAFLVGGLFYALAAFSGGRAMGGGDIKLVFMMGLILGLKGMALAMLIAFNSAAIVGIALILSHKKGRRDHIPFGPFLVAGTIIAFLYGQSIVSWYSSINGLT
jgi:prepilin signal peptidase PulO-like enzyme (type II secretory pathway)